MPLGVFNGMGGLWLGEEGIPTRRGDGTEYPFRLVVRVVLRRNIAESLNYACFAGNIEVL